MNLLATSQAKEKQRRRVRQIKKKKLIDYNSLNSLKIGVQRTGGGWTP